MSMMTFCPSTRCANTRREHSFVHNCPRNKEGALISPLFCVDAVQRFAGGKKSMLSKKVLA